MGLHTTPIDSEDDSGVFELAHDLVQELLTVLKALTWTSLGMIVFQAAIERSSHHTACFPYITGLRRILIVVLVRGPVSFAGAAANTPTD